MDSAFIHQAANELVQNAGTRNIKQIARSCSLDISETSRIKDMLGLLSLYFDKPLILINRQLDKQTKQMVCGYIRSSAGLLFHIFCSPLLCACSTLNSHFWAQTALCSRFLPISTAGFFAQHHPHNRSGCHWHPPHGGTG